MDNFRTLQDYPRWLFRDRLLIKLFFSYIGLYSVGRFLIEGLRLDSFWLGAIRVPQAASVVGVIVAIVGLIWVNRRSAAVA